MGERIHRGRSAMTSPVHPPDPARRLLSLDVMRGITIAFKLIAHIPDPGWATFAYSVSFTAICFVPVWMMYRRRIFLKV
jgi:predicted acyltransferase